MDTGPMPEPEHTEPEGQPDNAYADQRPRTRDAGMQRRPMTLLQLFALVLMSREEGTQSRLLRVLRLCVFLAFLLVVLVSRFDHLLTELNQLGRLI